MECQPHVCMRMRNTKYCIVEVASKTSFFKSCSRLNRKTIPLDIPEVLYTLGALTSCLHYVWNVVVTQVVYAFQSIEKKVM